MSPADLDEFTEPLRTYIEQNHLDGRAALPDDAPLLEWGILNSLSLVELIVFIEKRFALSVPADAITSSNFRNLQAIAAMLLALDHDSA